VTVFKGTSKTVQIELECMLSVCREFVTKTISNANCIAILYDETTDIATKQQFVLVYKCALFTAQVVERFWG
jgi:hypothetical protein